MDGYDWNEQNYSCFLLIYRSKDGKKKKEFYRHSSDAAYEMRNRINDVIKFLYYYDGYHHGFGRKDNRTARFLEDCVHHQRSEQFMKEKQKKERMERLKRIREAKRAHLFDNLI